MEIKRSHFIFGSDKGNNVLYNLIVDDYRNKDEISNN